MDKIINTLRPRQNGRHFPDDIFKCIFLNENVWISIKISLKFVPGGPNNNFPALVQIMAWRRPGDKPLPELMMVSLMTHICVTRPQWVKNDPFINRYFAGFERRARPLYGRQIFHQTTQLRLWCGVRWLQRGSRGFSISHGDIYRLLHHPWSHAGVGRGLGADVHTHHVATT